MLMYKLKEEDVMSCKQFSRGFNTEFKKSKRKNVSVIVFTVYRPNLRRDYTIKFRISHTSRNTESFKNCLIAYNICNCLVWKKNYNILDKTSMENYEPV